jgi:hypothetical protein
MRDNGNYLAANLNNHIINANQDPQRPNRVRAGSPLETLIDSQVSITCGDCHLHSAGANNRYADFRSSGCTSCHMEYSYDGRHAGFDPNVPRDEPANPDAIAAGERAHVLSHQIRNVAKILPNGAFVRGISDRACVGCHQGSNRTVLQYWGIRLDQNQNLVNNFQYPANPDTFQNTAQDQRLYSAAVANNTFNGRNANQYILTEDYDADGRDDTPPDIHYERGIGCIDCHGSRDLHGGVAGDATSGQIRSRMNQVVAVSCENCHGSVGDFAPTVPCTTYTGQAAECVTDSKGNPMRHVTKDGQGHFWLISRLDGQRHYLPQTKDITVLSQRTHPITSVNLYSPKASYAMGRADGNPATGTGPVQANPNLYTEGFSHMDTMDCQSCHASWTNNCIGCHLANEYDVNPANYFFSNITGERILLKQTAADFVYQSPVFQYLGVNSRGKITRVYPGQKVFWRFVDLNGDTSDVFVFSDRLGEGNNPAVGGRNDFPAGAMNQLMPHSIRGAVDAQNEGPNYCVSCHINDAMIDNADLMAQYAAFVAAYDNAGLCQHRLQRAASRDWPEHRQPEQLTVLRAHDVGHGNRPLPLRRQRLPGQPARRRRQPVLLQRRRPGRHLRRPGQQRRLRSRPSRRVQRHPQHVQRPPARELPGCPARRRDEWPDGRPPRLADLAAHHGWRQHQQRADPRRVVRRRRQRPGRSRQPVAVIALLSRSVLAERLPPSPAPRSLPPPPSYG